MKLCSSDSHHVTVLLKLHYKSIDLHYISIDWFPYQTSPQHKVFPKTHYKDPGNHNGNKSDAGNIIFTQSTRTVTWVPGLNGLFKSSEGFFLFHF